MIYPTFGSAMPGSYTRQLEAALEAFVDRGDAPSAATAIANAAVSSQRSFTRVWSLR